MDFIRANGGKIALTAAIFIIAGVVFAMQGDKVKAPANAVRYVCVETGKTYWLERGEARVLPGKNPDTGEKTLLPCFEADDGTVRVRPACRQLIQQLNEQGKNKFVDGESLAILDNPR